MLKWCFPVCNSENISELGVQSLLSHPPGTVRHSFLCEPLFRLMHTSVVTRHIWAMLSVTRFCLHKSMSSPWGGPWPVASWCGFTYVQRLCLNLGHHGRAIPAPDLLRGTVEASLETLVGQLFPLPSPAFLLPCCVPPEKTPQGSPCTQISVSERDSREANLRH